MFTVGLTDGQTPCSLLYPPNLSVGDEKRTKDGATRPYIVFLPFSKVYVIESRSF